MGILQYIIEAVVIGVLFVEFGGYLWHRFVEHEAVLGKSILYRHIVHHEKHFPYERLRTKVYISAWSWSWLVLAAVANVAIWAIGLSLFSWQHALAVSIGANIYGFVFVSRFHDIYHIEGYWMNKWKWFRTKTLNHDIHHIGAYNYGIIFLWFDRLFGTYKDENDLPELEKLGYVRDFPADATL